MSIKELRALTGLTQRDFAQKYHIPMQTLKQWESNPASTSYRMPPEYVTAMLERLVGIDYGVNTSTSNKRISGIIEGAKQSRYNASHWMRYLRKNFDGDRFLLSNGELYSLLDSNELTLFQKVSLSRAAVDNSPTSRYVSSLNKKASPAMLDEIMRRHNPEALRSILHRYGFGEVDESLLLEAFGRAYGMEWLEKYYVEHEDEILGRM